MSALPHFPVVPAWPGDGTHRIPFLTYTSDALYRRELERFFYQGHWCYVGLEAEVPLPGDFKRTAETADRGARAAEALADRLRPLAVSETAYAAWSESIQIARRDVRFRHEVRDERLRIAAEDAVDEAGDHRATHLAFADARLVEELPPVAARRDRAALLEPREQRGDRRVREAARRGERVGDIGRARLAARPEHAHHVGEVPRAGVAVTEDLPASPELRVIFTLVR